MTTISKLSAFFSALAMAAFLLMVPKAALAAGGEGGGSVPNCKSGTVWNFAKNKCMGPDDVGVSAKNKSPIKCSRNRIWNAKAKKCVKAAKSSSLDQNSIFTYGRSLARAERYDDAIRVLYLAPDQNDPRVLNFLGFSNRKLGNMDKALGYYQAAVANDPDFVLVREYLGEAYVQLGKMEKAREQLTQIERICGTQNCREYAMLSNYMIDSQL